MIAAPVVVSIHRALALSGVSVAGARMASLPSPFSPWRPIVVGADLTPASLAKTPFADVPGVVLATWKQGASPLAQVAAVRKAVRALGAAVVVTNDVPHAFVVASLEHHRGVRCLAWHHSSGHDGDDLMYRCGPLADAWMAVSAGLQRRIEGLGVELPPALPPAPVCCTVPDRPAPFLPATRTLRIIYAGRLERHHKRVLDLVELADRLTGLEVRFRLTIAGDGPAAAELEEAMAAQIRAGRVSMLGAVDPAEMPRLYAGHDVAVLVSEHEGWPLTVMESMAMGRPVAITRGCGGATDIITHGVNGWVVDVGDMAAMASTLAGLSDRRPTIANMGLAAFDTVREQLTPAALGPVYEQAISAALRTSVKVSPQAAQLEQHWNRLLAGLEAIGPCEEPDLRRLRDAWLKELGTTGDGAALALQTPGIACTAERLVRRAVDRLRAQGARRIAIYGAGAHTGRAERAIRTSPEVVAIVDDRVGDASSEVMLGLPLCAPRRISELGVQAVIISSDEHERSMLLKARSLWPGLRVMGLYHGEPGDQPRSVAA